MRLIYAILLTRMITENSGVKYVLNHLSARCKFVVDEFIHADVSKGTRSFPLTQRRTQYFASRRRLRRPYPG